MDLSHLGLVNLQSGAPDPTFETPCDERSLSPLGPREAHWDRGLLLTLLHQVQHGFVLPPRVVGQGAVGRVQQDGLEVGGDVLDPPEAGDVGGGEGAVVRRVFPVLRRNTFILRPR